jgi:hypothetical protein
MLSLSGILEACIRIIHIIFGRLQFGYCHPARKANSHEND